MTQGGPDKLPASTRDLLIVCMLASLALLAIYGFDGPDVVSDCFFVAFTATLCIGSAMEGTLNLGIHSHKPTSTTDSVIYVVSYCSATVLIALILLWYGSPVLVNSHRAMFSLATGFLIFYLFSFVEEPRR